MHDNVDFLREVHSKIDVGGAVFREMCIFKSCGFGAVLGRGALSLSGCDEILHAI